MKSKTLPALLSILTWLLAAMLGHSETASHTNSSRQRSSLPSHGLYEDFRAVVLAPAAPRELTTEVRQKLSAAARTGGIRAVLTVASNDVVSAWRGMHEDVMFLNGADNGAGEYWFPNYGADGKPVAEGGVRLKKVDADDGLPAVLARATREGLPTNVAGNLTLHVLAREFTEPSIREALAGGHLYAANDALCESRGFMFGAVNNQGVYNMGDEALMLGKTRLIAITPRLAKLRLLHNGASVEETFATNLIFEAKDAGAYRFEAWLTVGGEEQLWIYSSPVVLVPPGLNELARVMALANLSPDVKVEKGISYLGGPEEVADKHKLDIYLPKIKTNAPVLFFIHGGAWKTGDRSYYLPLGNRYAREGFVTVAPSYRLAPKHPYPAQLEDTAAAFAWTMRHIGGYGGDTNRIFVAGHSAGGHLAALLVLDERALATHQLSPKLIRGVLAFSGVYNLTAGEGLESVFGKDLATRRAAAPLTYVKAGAPPFLVTYCQWDYFSLPAQAKEFHAALLGAGNRSELLYVPGESHLSEMIGVTRTNDLTVAAALEFMKRN